MSILHLKSTNENLSYIISKNPQSGMTAKTLRKGTLFGFFPNGKENEYVAYFSDKLNDVSFSENANASFEYLDITRYSSALLQTSIVNDLFRSAFKKQAEHDVPGHTHTLQFTVKILRNAMIFKAFEGIQGITVRKTEIAKNHYEVLIETDVSIYYLLNTLVLFALMVAITNGDEFFVDTTMSKKYAEILAMLDVPYQLRYLYQLKVLPNRKLFKNSQSILEKSKRYTNLKLHNGSTADWRFNFVNDKLDLTMPIVEVGCGEGFYTVPLGKKATLPYAAIDIDKDVLQTTQRKLAKRQIEGITFHETLTDYLATEYQENPTNVLLMEVIEHMPIEQSKELIREVLTMNVHRLYISTPMKEFNVHYFGENTDAMRHDDHDWEATKEEFLTLIEECLEGTDYTFTYHLIGDQVDGAAPSQAVIIQSK